jgi:hypothetical protein
MTYLETLLQKHFNKSILVDTNLLLLFLYGAADRENLSKYKRTNKYTEEDFELLRNLLSQFSKIIYTPHILTEISNLTEKGNAAFYRKVLEKFSLLAVRDSEVFVSSETLIQKKSFSSFGLADSAIADIAESGTLIITDDLPLYGFLSLQGFDVINFTQIRGLRILSEG